MSPMLTTDRLTLRRFEAADCAAVVPLLGDFAVAKMLAHIPHPYAEDHFLAWMDQHAAWFEAGTHFPMAIVHEETGVVGAIGLHWREDGSFELGYWLGKPYWGQGFATEAGHALLGWFTAMRPQERVKASHFEENPASGRVLAKLGFVYTGEKLTMESLARGEAVTSLAMTYAPKEERP
jgi:RimJ/RimL family protein N-acetyltransferase